jgi:hypothetical protein
MVSINLVCLGCLYTNLSGYFAGPVIALILLENSGFGVRDLNCRIVRAHGLKLGDGFGQGFVAGSEGLVDLGGFASADQNQAGIGTTQRPGERKARLW